MHSEPEQKQVQEKEKEEQVISIFEQYVALQRQLLSKQEEQEKVIATLTAEKLRELQRQLLPKTREEQESPPDITGEYKQLISLLSLKTQSAESLQEQVKYELSAAKQRFRIVKMAIICIRTIILTTILFYSIRNSSLTVVIVASCGFFFYAVFEMAELIQQTRVITSVAENKYDPR